MLARLIVKLADNPQMGEVVLAYAQDVASRLRPYLEMRAVTEAKLYFKGQLIDVSPFAIGVNGESTSWPAIDLGGGWIVRTRTLPPTQSSPD